MLIKMRIGRIVPAAASSEYHIAMAVVVFVEGRAHVNVVSNVRVIVATDS